MLLKGIDLTGGLRDLFLMRQQRAENRIEYLKTLAAVQAAAKDIDGAQKSLDALRELLALSVGVKKDDWMNDPEQVEQNMEFLKNMTITIEG